MVSKKIQFNHISEEQEDSFGAFTVQIRHTSIPDADLRTDVFRYLKLRLCHDPAIVTFFGVIGWPNL